MLIAFGLGSAATAQSNPPGTDQLVQGTFDCKDSGGAKIGEFTSSNSTWVDFNPLPDNGHSSSSWTWDASQSRYHKIDSSGNPTSYHRLYFERQADGTYKWWRYTGDTMADYGTAVVSTGSGVPD